MLEFITKFVIIENKLDAKLKTIHIHKVFIDIIVFDTYFGINNIQIASHCHPDKYNTSEHILYII